ncbi:hypothetical protein BMF94_1534 [Rhodotorula taiwanensis]|uniref:AN1-type domain-containing protein n=1 Tax=Rhodotorula taiwanensis TaxID=741276 RepID=A0A2S5BF27_9BASI|nr:hypothetical protein BMF94_1534 [Rhodotorula taiwanensis]
MHSQEFLDIGRHCKEPSCNQLDFLPFKCPSCRLDFCSDHWRPPAGHKCSEYDETKADNRVPTCPLCSQPVSFPLTSDPNIAMDRHLSTACPVLLPELASSLSSISSSGRGPAPKRSPNECSARGCKTKMIVPIECDSCHRKFCPSHRWKTDHACESTGSGSSNGATGGSGGSGKKAFGGLFARSNGPAKQPGLAGLAALRRAQHERSGPKKSGTSAAAAKSTSNPLVANGRTAPGLVPTTANDGDSDIEIVSYKPAPGAKAGGTDQPGKSAQAGKKALASVGVASKTDKRARAEQESKRKALEVRAKKGLLTETEKVQYATLQALAQREGKNGEGDSCVVV